jgi:hypothetical protein
MISPFVQHNFHSPVNSHVVGLSLEKEGRASLETLFLNAEVAAMFERIRDKGISVVAVADWKALEYFLGLLPANTSSIDGGVCFLCNFVKKFQHRDSIPDEAFAPRSVLEIPTTDLERQAFLRHKFATTRCTA